MFAYTGLISTNEQALHFSSTRSERAVTRHEVTQSERRSIRKCMRRDLYVTGLFDEMVSDEVLFFGTKRSEEGMRRVMRSNEVRQQFGASISEATF